MATDRQGYYEIRGGLTHGDGLKAMVLAGNLLFNGLHWHSSLELLFCLRGRLQVNLAGEVLEMTAGDLLTIDSGLSHEIFDGVPGGLQIITLVDASLLHRAEGERYALSTVGRYAKPRGDAEILSVQQSLRRMAWLLTPEPADGQEAAWPDGSLPLRSEAEWNWFNRELYNVLWHLSRNKQTVAGNGGPAGGQPQKNLRACLEILNRDFAQELNAAAVAEKAGVSEPTLYRMFKKQIGVSFSSYLNMVRVNAACGYLENTNWDMTTVAEKSGFTSLSNFYRVFRQYRGCPPGTWQKEKLRQPGRRLPIHQDIMGLNRFQPLGELPYGRDSLLGED